MTTHDDSPAFAASGYDQQEMITADRIVATDAGRDRLVACTDSAVHIVAEDGTVAVEGPEDAVNDGVAVGRSNVCLLADGTVYPLTERGLLGRSYDIDADTIAIPTRSSVVIAATGGEVAGFDIRTGRERFRKPPTGVSDPDAEIEIVAGERRFYALVDGTVMGFDSRGREQFAHEFSAPIEAAGEVGGTLVVALASDRLAWMDAESGEVLLSAPVDVAPHSLVPAADRFLFGAAGDSLVVVDSEEKFATLGDASTDALVQTADGSLVGRVLADGFGIERLQGTPEASIDRKSDGPGPVVETHNPLPIAVSFSLTVSTEEGDNEESLEYSVNAGEADETPLVPLIDADPGTYLTVSVETEDGETILHDEVGVLPEDDQGDDQAPDAGQTGRTPDQKPPSKGMAGAGRIPNNGPSGRGGYGLPNDPSDTSATSDNPASSGSQHSTASPVAKSGESTPETTTEALQPSEDTGDTGTTEAPLSVEIQPETLAAADGKTRGALTFRLCIRNNVDDKVVITDVDPKRPAKLGVDDTLVATTLSPDEERELILSLPDRSGATVEVEVHWQHGKNDGIRTVETTVPRERLDVSAEIVDTGEQPVVAVTADNRLQATIEDRITFAADGLPGYEGGRTLDLTLAPGPTTVVLVAADPTSAPPNNIRVKGEAVVDTTEVTFDTPRTGNRWGNKRSGETEASDVSDDVADGHDGGDSHTANLPANDSDVLESSDDDDNTPSGSTTSGTDQTNYSHARSISLNDGEDTDNDPFVLRNADCSDRVLEIDRNIELPYENDGSDGASITASVSVKGVADDSEGLLFDAIRIKNTHDTPVEDLSVVWKNEERGPWRVDANDTAVVGRLYASFGQTEIELDECVVETDEMRQDVAAQIVQLQQQPSVHVRARFATNSGSPVLTLVLENMLDQNCPVTRIGAHIDGTDYEWEVGLPEIPAGKRAVWRGELPASNIDSSMVSTNWIDVRYEIDGEQEVQNSLYRVVEWPHPVPEVWPDPSVKNITKKGGEFAPIVRLMNQLDNPIKNFTMEFPNDWGMNRRTQEGNKLLPGDTVQLNPTIDQKKWAAEWNDELILAVPIETKWDDSDGETHTATVTLSGRFDPHTPKWNTERTHIWRLLDDSRTADMQAYATFFDEWPDELHTPWQRYDV